MELEVGMYVRTKDGNIRKIVELTNTKFIDEPDYYVDKVLIDIEQNEREDTIYMEKWLFNESILKASHNIIDLIEVGDYVNGYKVITNKKEYIELNNADLNYDCIEYQRILKNKYSEIAINSIVTKEQFESMEYKVDNYGIMDKKSR